MSLKSVFSREQRIARIERRMGKRLRQQYANAEAQNGYWMSMGAGIVPFPTFEEWLRGGRKV